MVSSCPFGPEAAAWSWAATARRSHADFADKGASGAGAVPDAAWVVHLDDPLVSDLLSGEGALADALMDALWVDAEQYGGIGDAHAHIGHGTTSI